jgi:hypothetical protein
MAEDITLKYKVAHQKLYDKYANPSLVAQEKMNAELIEEFLHNLKLFILGRKLQLNQLDKIIFSEMVKTMENNLKGGAKLKNILFHSGGQATEKDIGRLHQVAEAALLQNISPMQDIVIGDVQAGIGTDVSTVISEHIIEQLNVNIEKFVGKEFYQGLIKTKQGKIDIKGNNSITVNYSAPLNDQIWQLIASSNFQVKNKTSVVWNRESRRNELQEISQISFGSTSAYRSIVSMLNSIGMSPSEDIFSEGIIESVNNNLEITYHLNHMQFIYELTGAGQYYKGLGPIGENNYIIINDPSSDMIQVLSVKALIAEELQYENPRFELGTTLLRKNVSKNKLIKKIKTNKYFN